MVRHSDNAHADPCRKCGVVAVRSSMVRAAKVLKRSGARGYYCQQCALRAMDLEAWLKQSKAENVPKPRYR